MHTYVHIDRDLSQFYRSSCVRTRCHFTRQNGVNGGSGRACGALGLRESAQYATEHLAHFIRSHHSAAVSVLRPVGWVCSFFGWHACSFVGHLPPFLSWLQYINTYVHTVVCMDGGNTTPTIMTLVQISPSQWPRN